MRVTLFARVDTALNPYLLLLKEALERQGVTVHLEREFGLKWLLSKSKSCEAVHLHWMESAYKPGRRYARHLVLRKLMENRLVMPLRGAFRLADFSAALFLAKLGGKTIVYTVHNLEPHSKLSWPFLILNRLAHWIVLSQSSHVHVHSQYTRQVIASVYKRTGGVTVVPHGNYIGRYPNQVSQLDARRQLGLPEDGFVYLFLGLLRSYKGVEDLMNAFGKLEWTTETGRLLIAGQVFEAGYEAKLLSLAQNNPAIKLVLKFVPDEDIQLYMNACNVCVLPYKEVTTSAAAVLAFSFGRPIIAPSIASFPELVTPGVGILYDPSQPDALVSVLQEARRRSWSEAEIADYAHQFDWDKLGPRLATLYQSSRQ